MKVSICIPAYEQAKNLNKCLKSIVKQSFQDFEVIITDDSESFDLLEIVKKYEKIIRIKYIRNKFTKGSPENWNESIKYGIGKYVKILHHDDFFKSKDSLKEFVDLLEYNPKSKVVFSSSEHVDINGEYLSQHILSDKQMSILKNNPEFLFFGNVIGAPSIMMYHRELNLTFDSRMKWFVDIDFYIRLLKNNQFVYTKSKLVCINIGEEQRITKVCENSKKINIYETMIILEKFQLEKFSIHYKWHFIKLFTKYEVYRISDIKKSGYKGSIPKDITKLLKYMKFISFLYKLMKKIKHAIK